VKSSEEDPRLNSPEKGNNSISNRNNKNLSQIKKEKEIIDSWSILKKQSLFDEENLKINNYINKSQENINNINNIESSKNPHGPNIKFSLAFSLKSYCCNPKTTKEKKKLQVFSNLNDYLNKRMDLTYYLRTLHTIDITNSLLLNPFQKKLLEYPFKPNIFSSEDLHAFGLDKQEEASFPKSEITDYFAARIEKKKLDKYDRKIFKVLPKALLGEIDIEQ